MQVHSPDDHTSMQPLAPLTLPLKGNVLIEASAGTGKTYTLVLLYLRLLLEKRYSVDQILVVTFTRAATRELRDRIRIRLREALDVLEGRYKGAPDPILAELLASKAPQEKKEQQQILEDALVQMDLAAIYTIHSFCQRVLQENAFESGAPFAMDFQEEGESQGLKETIIHDFWRKRFYPAPAHEVDWLQTLWKTPAELLQAVQPLLKPGPLELLPLADASFRADLEQDWADLQAKFSQIRDLWLDQEARQEVEAILYDTNNALSRAAKAYHVEKQVPAILAEMDSFFSQSHDTPPWQINHIQLLSASIMAGKLKKKPAPPEHELFDLMDVFIDLHEGCMEAQRIILLQETSDFLFQEQTRRKKETGNLSFDDLIVDLHAALCPDTQNDAQNNAGRGLAQRIYSLYPVALVDEFQDTDPLQYEIFTRIYNSKERPGTLIMIGDPKQAIYSFRGADIFAYIQAKQETPAEQRFTMDTNYRSANTMVAAVNRIFDQPSSFLFAEYIPFFPVQAAPGAEQHQLYGVECSDEPQVPLTALVFPEDITAETKAMSKEDGTKLASQACAQEVAMLLRHPAERQGKGARTDRPYFRRNGQKIPVQAGDIAILVRTNMEALQMERALKPWGIKASLQIRKSVFATQEAVDMERLLLALHTPEKQALVKDALATVFFAYTAADIDRLSQDSSRQEELSLTFQDLRRIWHQQGILAMIHALLSQEKTVYRLTGQTEGQRRLTNLVHLAELLQEEERQHRGKVSQEKSNAAAILLRWLHRQRSNPQDDSETQQLRLESDANLVQIVTLHKSKGLEYPLVFLPFLWSVRKAEKKDHCFYHTQDKETGQFRLRLQLSEPSALEQKRAEEERLAEDLRLLYVSLTRARSCCFFCWGPVQEMERSALSWLLPHANQRENECLEDSTSWHPLLTSLQQVSIPDNGAKALLQWKQVKEREVQGEKEKTSVTSAQQEQGKEPYAAKSFHGQIPRPWQMLSYSSLLRQHQVDKFSSPSHNLAPPVFSTQEYQNYVLSGEASEPHQKTSFTFPKGPLPGTCLHTLLEEVDSLAAPFDPQQVEQRLGMAGIEAEWTDPVITWLNQVRQTPLFAQCTLQGIAPKHQINEMEFHIPLEQVQLQGFNAILHEYGYQPLQMPSHTGMPGNPGTDGQRGGGWREQQSVLNGFMRGFIDLIFFWQGQFFIVDYKSNFLGARPEHYAPAQLPPAIFSHRYDLQYLFYSLALHRYLSLRVPGYTFADHFGGVLYLFLRGMHPEYPAGNGIFKTCPPQGCIEAMDRCFAGSQTAMQATS